MAVRIRLTRKGGKKHPFYRIIVTDSRSPRDGRFIDQLGYYDPNKDPADVKIDREKLKAWISKGAEPTLIVKQMLKKVGINQPIGP